MRQLKGQFNRCKIRPALFFASVWVVSRVKTNRWPEVRIWTTTGPLVHDWS